MSDKTTPKFSLGEAVRWLDAAVNVGQEFSGACARFAKKAGITYDELRDAYIRHHD